MFVNKEKVQNMKRVASAIVLATLGLNSVTASAAYADGYSYYGAPAKHRAPANMLYGYVPGETTTFFNVVGYGYTHGGSTVRYNGYVPYPYGGRWWQRPWPSGPVVWW